MILTDFASYEMPIDAWVAPASGDVVCPICGNFIREISGVILNSRKNIVFLEVAFHTRVIHSPWYLAEDLALLCSESCLDIHNLLGGVYA